ncbi:MAG: tripartite tricarboxylate transporter substrate binding protein [Betaproteobacteria bacterium]|nr:MAG: tripartite tricarboxylate transporter substrate binding protein [Betaproteobacteria bacterium]
MSMLRLAFFTLSLIVSGAALAQGFPSRPVRIVVPFPGGVADTLARMMAPKMSEALGQPVVVENKPGGSGQIGAVEVIRAPADGHTIFLGHIGTHAVNPHLFTKLNYDPEKDFSPITLLITVPNLLVVHPSVPAASVRELVAYAKSRPGALSYASPGSGSSGHLAAELFKSMAGVDIVHVPYKGAAPALQDLMGGQVQVLFDTLAQALPQAKIGKVRALAVTTLKRQPVAPDIPTMDEQGFPGWETGPWFGFFVRAGTPEPVAGRLHLEAVRALNAAEVRDRLAALGANVVGNTSAEFAAFIHAERARWGKVVRAAGIRAD